MSEFEDNSHNQSQILNLTLEGFEGPIDLLLNLVREQKIDLSKIQIVGNSADTSLFKPLTKNKNLLVSIGNLRWQKDYLTLIRAFKIFYETNPQAKLLIFGEGPERKILESKINVPN